MQEKGINCLKSISINKNIEGDRLPKVYNSFINLFSAGNQCLSTQHVKLSNEDIIKLTCIEYKNSINGEEYISYISQLFTQEEIVDELKRFENKVDDYHDREFIKIGSFDICDSILLNIHNDEIWALKGDWGTDKPFAERLNKDIFEFFNCCREALISLNLEAFDVNMNKLTKRWGDDLWYQS